MCNMMALAHPDVWHVGKPVREWNVRVLITRKLLLFPFLSEDG